MTKNVKVGFYPPVGAPKCWPHQDDRIHFEGEFWGIPMPSDGILGGIIESVTIGLQIRLIFVFLLKLGNQALGVTSRKNLLEL